jgi:hypothetical protein
MGFELIIMVEGALGEFIFEQKETKKTKMLK